MRRWIAIVTLAAAACGGDDEANPPPLGSGSASTTVAPVTVGVSTGSETGTDGSSTSESGTTDASSGSMSSSGPSVETGSPVETGSETPCGNWAEVYVGCIGADVPIAELEQQCDVELAGWEEPLPNCRVLAEELLICVTQVPCQAFIDWELNHAVPRECAKQLEALEQACSFVGTTSA